MHDRGQPDISTKAGANLNQEAGANLSQKSGANMEQEGRGADERQRARWPTSKQRSAGAQGRDCEDQLMGIQVCMGATLQCSFGAAPSTLVVPPDKKVLTQTPAATIMDYQPIVEHSAVRDVQRVVEPAGRRGDRRRRRAC
jgi:hypothetical protein